ncbi:DUF4007 family protein [Flavobacterium ardleyense]|uniref:DUF4007 family protein n=1 Tax=Flavobacterium ardleyense TaxID=2038737 RepID=UPI00298D3301|nr:DUF4007 family protein [Flavobacterium ardleyense]
MILKFSGHDTFHCRQQWLSKGLQFIENHGYNSFNNTEVAISNLGVGKNMVQSIQHWLRAFDLISENHEIKEFARDMFFEPKSYDPYLEDEGSLWLLQYKICKTQYASIYNIIFAEYFNDKLNLEFSEFQIIQFIERKIRDKSEREVSKNTLSSDFKAFIKLYTTPTKTLKTIEDDFNSPLLELNLISQLSATDGSEKQFRLNKEDRSNIPTAIFAYCLLDQFDGKEIVNYDEVRRTLGAYFCLSNESLDNLIDLLSTVYSEFVYKNDAGIRQIQIKGLDQNFKNDLLQAYYEKQ